MESILLLIIFLVFRTIFSHLIDTQKTQKHPFPKTPVRSREYPQPPIQDIKTIEINGLKTVETKAPIISTPSEEANLQKIYKGTPIKPERLQREPLQQAEPEAEISKLFVQENILRGIILKEILSPPKALRQRYR